MTAPAHPPTCVCYDCLPGGAREHRVRPWPATADRCSHPEHDGARKRLHGDTRLRIPLRNGAVLVQCRLCGSILSVETTESPSR